jgi:HSP20 family protein
MALARWSDQDSDFFANPFRALLDPRFFGPSLLTANQPTTADVRPIALDVVEKPDAYEIRADIPGVDEADINLSVDGDVLTISVDADSTKEDEKEQDGVRVHRLERSSTFVRRAIRLPDSADLENIDANYENGVLKISIPKKEPTSRQKTIKVGKGSGNKKQIEQKQGEGQKSEGQKSEAATGTQGKT